MQWYYTEGSQQAGPVTEPQLDGLFQSGRIHASTLVWHQGMGSWLPLAEVKPNLLKDAEVKAALKVKESPIELLNAPVKDVVCSQCNQIFSRAELRLIRDNWVCAECRPGLVQRIKDGTFAGRRLEYAGTGARFVAKILDNLIFGGVIGLAVFAGLSIMSATEAKTDEEIKRVVMISLAIAAAGGLLIIPIKIWCLATKGGTPGKRILKLRVISASGENIGWGKAAGRVFAEGLSVPLLIGYLLGVFDTEKRTLHDRIAGTRVVKD